MTTRDTKRQDRVVVQRAVVRDGQVVDADSPESAAFIEEEIRRSRARDERRHEVWGTGSEDRIVTLARSFPTLADAGGLEPWDAVDFLDWALGPGCTSGSWHAAMFVLSVWNQTTDWSEVAREQGWLRDPEPVHDGRVTAIRLGLVTDANVQDVPAELVDRAAHAITCGRKLTFHVSRAFGVWDDAHRNAFLAWCNLPFFP